MKQIRQGDVLLVCVNALPKDAVEQPAINKLIIEYGEATGHHHRFDDVLTAEGPKVKLYHDARAAQYIKVLEESPFTHEEHDAILIENGLFRRAYQVEEQRKEIRRVVD